MYVCLKPSSVYVCMPQTYIHDTKHTYTVSCHHAFGRPLSMYVCLKTLCFIMKMKHTYTLKVAWKAKKIILRHLLSVYVCFKTMYFVMKMKHQRSNIHSPFLSKIILSEPLERVCMFEIPVFYRSQLLKHTRSATLVFEWWWCELFMYVCYKTLCFIVRSAIGT